MDGIEQLRSRLGLGHAPATGEPEIHVLTPGEARNLRLPWLSRFGPSTLSQHVARYPDMTLWVPETGEYIVAEPWRSRDDVANVIEVTARKCRAVLVQSLLDRLRDDGYRLALLATEVWQDQTRLNVDLGFGRVETIVFFEMPFKRGTPPPVPDWTNPLPGIEYVPIDLDDLEPLLMVDHDSFPWLWWNSRAEMEAYLQIRGVYAFMAHYEGEPVGYASFTIYRAWAHLDRLAVVHKHQGRKFGAAQLAHAMQLMVSRGANSVALSTQAANVQSHRLYKGFGFHQTSEMIHFYGKALEG